MWFGWGFLKAGFEITRANNIGSDSCQI